MKKICIIPARGGSKRVPRKNIKLLDGKPLIYYSILTARESSLFDRIVVSTDDHEISDIARGFGADVPFLRPAHLSDDFTGTVDVVKHTLDLLSTSGCTYEYVCCIYAAAPLLQPKYLSYGLERLIESGADYSYSVTRSPNSVDKALNLSLSGFITPMFPAKFKGRSQDKPVSFYDAAQFYWGRSKAFTDALLVADSKSVGIEIPRKYAQDIDTEEDFELAEILFRELQRSRTASI